MDVTLRLKPLMHEKRVCLMDKEEMLNDGQDEPVTSISLKKHEKNLVYPPMIL